MILSIIIPVYNEAPYIEQVINAVSELDFSEKISQSEIIVVDDASNDNSYEIAKTVSENINNIKVLKHKNNKGKGAAVQTALKNATGNLFIIQDADLELSPKEIPQMVNLLIKNDLELVNGSRFLNDFLHTDNSLLRNFANKMFSFFASVLNRTKITDLTCGYKLFTQNLLTNITLQEKGFGIESELLIKALKFNKKKVKEFSVKYTPREISSGKKIRSTDSFRILWTIIKYSSAFKF